MENITRRRFVIQSSKLLAFLPFVGATGCIPDTYLRLSPADALKRLIYIIGPWSIEDNSIAQDFARRFIKTIHAPQYLAKSNNLIDSLTKHVSQETLAAKEIDLNILSNEEQEILIALLQQLYSFIEVRFHASKVPPWGQCQGDPLWHTRIPK